MTNFLLESTLILQYPVAQSVLMLTCSVAHELFRYDQDDDTTISFHGPSTQLPGKQQKMININYFYLERNLQMYGHLPNNFFTSHTEKHLHEKAQCLRHTFDSMC